MLSELDGNTSIRQWKKIVNMYCQRCYNHSDHRFMQTTVQKTVVRKSHSGVAHYAQYKCPTDECLQVVEVEIFIRHAMQTAHMFPPNNDEW